MTDGRGWRAEMSKGDKNNNEAKEQRVRKKEARRKQKEMIIVTIRRNQATFPHLSFSNSSFPTWAVFHS